MHCASGLLSLILLVVTVSTLQRSFHSPKTLHIYIYMFAFLQNCMVTVAKCQRHHPQVITMFIAKTHPQRFMAGFYHIPSISAAGGSLEVTSGVPAANNLGRRQAARRNHVSKGQSIYWLVVWNIFYDGLEHDFYFSILYGTIMDNPSH